MAKTESKQVQVLSNGTEVKTSEKGWNPRDVANVPVLFSGWNAGSAAHYSIGAGLALACKDKIPGAYLGDFEVEDEHGNVVTVPVIDPAKVMEAMFDAFKEKHDLEIPTVRAAGNRTSAKLELENTYKELAADPQMMELLQAQKPDLYEKVKKYL